MATTIQQIELPKKARAVDTSGNNNHGQIYSGRGLEFDGIGDYIHAPLDGNPGNFGNQSDFETTIAFWVKVNDFVAANAFMQWARTGEVTDGTPFVLLALNGTDGSSRLYVDGDYRNLTHKFQAEVWYRFVVTRTASDNTWRVYINGVADVTHDDSGTPNNQANADSFYLGTGYNRYFSGAFSNAQVWNKAFTQADVTYDYLNPESLALNNGGTALTESNLKLWYPMQDGHRGQQSYILDGANTGLGVELANYADGNITFNNDGASVASSNSLNSYNAVSDGSTGDARPRISFTLTTGQTYKIEYTPTLVLDGGVLDFFVGGSRLISNNDINTSFTKTFTSAAGYEGFDFDGSQAFNVDFTLSIKAINDKNHATTVFYGDELVTEGDFGNGGAAWTASGNITVAVDGGAFVSTGDSDGGYGSCAQAETLIAGRTYELNFDVTAVTGGASVYNYCDSLQKDLGTASVTGFTDTFVSDGTGGIDIRTICSNGQAVTIDNISLKEVGVASGWTDADQQLHIPQTALQSYNELAWSDGGASSAYVASLGASLGTNDFALSYVINCDTDDVKFLTLNKAASEGRIIHRLTSGRLRIYAEDSNGTFVNYLDATADSSLVSGQTYHVVEVYDRAADLITTYVNGVASGVTIDISSLSGSIGCDGSFVFNLFSGTSLAGIITEVALWKNTKLDATEVLELYNDGKPLDALLHTKASTLYGYWRNNGLSTWVNLANPGTKDTSSNTLTETILIPQGVDSTRDAQGFIMNKQKDTSCLNLTDEAYVDSPTGGFVGTSDFSISCWFKTTDSNAWLLMKGEQGGGGKRYALYVHTSNYLTAEIDDNSTFVTWNGSATVNDGDWHHVVVAYDRSGNGQIYLDGSADGSATDISSSTGSLDPTSHRDFTVGVNSDDETSGPYTGQVDGVLVYTKALSLTEVERNYNATKGNHRN